MKSPLLRRFDSINISDRLVTKTIIRCERESKAYSFDVRLAQDSTNMW